MNIAVTTVLKPDADSFQRARKKAEDLQTAFYEREKNLLHMSEKYGAEGFLIYGKEPAFFWSKEGTYRFHLGTAVLRISEMRKGHGDRLCNLLPEDCASVLDCTFGQGRDSIILSWYLRKCGEVISLEQSSPLYEVGKEGLAALTGQDGEITNALRRIRLLHDDFRRFLEAAAPDSFDVIYFDPMFRHPVKRKENSMEGFRNAAFYDPLTEDILRRAVKVARKKVIVKERPFSTLFRTDLFTEVHSKGGQTTAYGVIEL
mgnify:CR=1 FL=1